MADRLVKVTEGVELRNSDALDGVRLLETNSVNVCVTSPPYFRQRDYGVDGQLGLENTVADYLLRLLAVFREVRRALKDNGTLWVVMGDKFNGSGGAGGDYMKGGSKEGRRRYGRTFDPAFKRKDLLLVSAMFAIEMQRLGWYLRQEITWAKPSYRPEPAPDRPISTTEKVYLFSKSDRYFYRKQEFPQLTNVWEFRPEGDADGHEAPFSVGIPRLAIQLGAMPGDLVLDPFCGSSRTGIAALEHGCRYVGIDLSPEAIEISERKLSRLAEISGPFRLDPTGVQATLRV